jgi:SAM-dependent methyltransferase
MFNVAFLETLRLAEIARVAPLMPSGARVLEIGAGTGTQTLALRRLGFEVLAIDLADSNYATDQQVAITIYDGAHLPAADASIDVVYSSNVLEHVERLDALFAEMRRVMRPDARAIHVLPTHGWRFWSLLSAFPAAVQTAIDRRHGPWRRIARHMAAPFFQRAHGAEGGVLGELWRFRPARWRARFAQAGFEIERDCPMGLFYTGHMVRGANWPLDRRARAARWAGSACHLFVMRRRPGAEEG